ncbi:hypothetical protein GGR51DRAFT_555556 [Nemania sp. FL0031]|nr:hypothetical protein GGR51DRAFT_555556 [Nemania sp. FL0031]
MRLLNTTTFELHSEQGSVHQGPYAILSHRWIGDTEITFEQLSTHTEELKTGTRPLSSPQLDKIRGACDVARAKGFQWLWMDTCCINKNDTREYAEAINSMFSWYRSAELCITFLSDVQWDGSNGPEMFKSTEKDAGESLWFSRGWTLQELLAPRKLEFYDMDWKCMGNKHDLASVLADITGIDVQYHTGAKHLSEACIAVKMSWMAKRETKYPEDMAYSMIGIFNVHMPFVYGETGPRAFRRLQEILLSSQSMDESIFAWRMPKPEDGMESDIIKADWQSGEWGLLAASPKWFSGCGNLQVSAGYASKARSFRMTPKGMEAPIRRNVHKGAGILATEAVSVVFWLSLIGTPIGAIGLFTLRSMMNSKAKEDYPFRLNCFRPGPNGKRENVEIYLRPVTVETVHYFHRMVRRTGTNRLKPRVMPPYVEVKRIRCNEMGWSTKPIVDHGEGVVYQPQPGY